MNNEEAIEYIKNYKYDNEVKQAIDTVLDYISDLEKENTNAKYQYDLGYKACEIEFINKIRDKIEELEEYQKQVESKVKEKYSERDTLLQVIGGIYYLKELLEEEK